MRNTFFFTTKPYRLILYALLSVILVSCATKQSGKTTNKIKKIVDLDGPPAENIDVSQIPDAVPKLSKRSKYGNPKSYVVFGKRYHLLPTSKDYSERGIASWYGSKFHGRRTSSGEPYDMHGMTAAHKTLPLPTYVRVTNLKNNRQVILKVNDRGPFHENRIIDLSHTAAIKLGIKATGTGLVEVVAIDPKSDKTISTASKITKSTPIPSNSQGTPSAKAPPVPVGLYLQLGAFVSSQNAYNLVNKVNSTISTDKAIISILSKNNQKFYRVRIGPIPNVELADKLSQTLTENDFNLPRIIIE